MDKINFDTSIFESAPFPIWAINKSDRRIVFANSVAISSFGKLCFDQHFDTIIYPEEAYTEQFKNINSKLNSFKLFVFNFFEFF